MYVDAPDDTQMWRPSTLSGHAARMHPSDMSILFISCPGRQIESAVNIPPLQPFDLLGSFDGTYHAIDRMQPQRNKRLQSICRGSVALMTVAPERHKLRLTKSQRVDCWTNRPLIPRSLPSLQVGVRPRCPSRRRRDRRLHPGLPPRPRLRLNLLLLLFTERGWCWRFCYCYCCCCCRGRQWQRQRR